jgi:hypothetical protein
MVSGNSLAIRQRKSTWPAQICLTKTALRTELQRKNINCTTPSTISDCGYKWMRKLPMNLWENRAMPRKLYTKSNHTGFLHLVSFRHVQRTESAE